MSTTYMLRRTLCPWNVEAIVDETVAACQRCGVDEIIWITESSGMYRELLPLKDIQTLLPGLHYAKEKTESAGMVYSLNPLTTIGHGEYGNDIPAIHPQMDFMVNFSGTVSPAAACPLSPYWRELMAETFKLYAATKPTRIWIEDDFRYGNHGKSVSFGCYCPLHMEEFARRTGKHLTRETLLARILDKQSVRPERTEWFQALADTLADAVALIARSVHGVSPNTTVAFMINNPHAADLTAVDVRKLLNACADGHSSALRMSITHYTENNARDLLLVDENLKIYGPQLPQHTLPCTEVETHPHSLYAKSSSGIAAQMEWAGILGTPNHTLNIFDYLGSPMAQVAAYGHMLKSRKPGLQSFAAAFAGTTASGVNILHRPLMSDSTLPAAGDSPAELAPRGCGFANSLRAFGIPVVYDNKHGTITAVSGQTLRAFDRADLECLFRHGVLLDIQALAVLNDLGLGHLAGCAVAPDPALATEAIGPEELTDPEFGGGPFHYTWTHGLMVPQRLEPAAGARLISRIVDTSGRERAPGFVLFENSLGGRVALCPYNLGGSGLDPYQKREPQPYYSEYRKQQTRAIIRWLGFGTVPLQVEADGWILPHRADTPGRILAAAMNISDDDWQQPKMLIACTEPVGSVRFADIDCRWQMLPQQLWNQNNGEVTLSVPLTVPPKRTIAAEVKTLSP